MPLDPGLERLLQMQGRGLPASDDYATRRALANATMMLIHPGPQAGVSFTDHTIEVEDGTITVRTYLPSGIELPAPAFLFIHGGGWFQGKPRDRGG